MRGKEERRVSRGERVGRGVGKAERSGGRGDDRRR